MALPGNTCATKLKEPEVRQEAYRQYCAHIASGMPKEAFFFDHPTHSVCYKTMGRYIKENPNEFPSHLLEQARSKRHAYWLNEGRKLMQGQYKHGSPVVWQTIMRNIFRDIGWDSPTDTNHVSPETSEQLRQFTDLLANQRNKV